MKRLTILCLLFVISKLLAAPSIFVQTRQDGIWLVYSNTPTRWSLQHSTNLWDWSPMLEGRTNMDRVEVQLKSGMEMIYYRLQELP